jgi:hypothetical protein
MLCISFICHKNVIENDMKTTYMTAALNKLLKCANDISSHNNHSTAVGAIAIALKMSECLVLFVRLKKKIDDYVL